MAFRTPTPAVEERPPWPLRLFDDIALLLAVGLIVPTVIYIVLGLLNLVSVPAFTP